MELIVTQPCFEQPSFPSYSASSLSFSLSILLNLHIKRLLMREQGGIIWLLKVFGISASNGTHSHRVFSIKLFAGSQMSVCRCVGWRPNTGRHGGHLRVERSSHAKKMTPCSGVGCQNWRSTMGYRWSGWSNNVDSLAKPSAKRWGYQERALCPEIFVSLESYWGRDADK